MWDVELVSIIVVATFKVYATLQDVYVSYSEVMSAEYSNKFEKATNM